MDSSPVDTGAAGFVIGPASVSRCFGSSGRTRVTPVRVSPDDVGSGSWKASGVTVRARCALYVLAVAVWAASVAGYAFTFVVHLRLDDLVRTDLATDGSAAVVYGAALFSAATVGLVVSIRQPRHPVGWLFLALSVCLAIGAAGDAFALDRGVVGEARSNAVGVALVAGQASFIAWFALLAAILHLTPTGRTLSRRWRVCLIVTEVSAALSLLAKAMQDTPFEAPFRTLRNPFAVTSIQDPVDLVAGVGISLVALGLVIGAVSLVVRFRRAEGVEREQLRWMTLVAAAVPVLLVASVVAALTGVVVVRTVGTAAR